MNLKTTLMDVAGAAGRLECALDAPLQVPPLGLAVVCHPHPLHGGTMDNKVAQTLARAFVQLGWLAVRFNFRGVGASEGAWDEGRGEVEDALAVLAHHRKNHADLILAGFSFGAYVAAEAAQRLPSEAKPQRLVLIGPSTQKQTVPPVPANTIVIHGEADEVVPLSATLDWARPQNLPITVFPGVGHFFHGQLGLLRSVLTQQLQTSKDSH
jgi:uncharacterized protein